MKNHISTSTNMKCPWWWWWWWWKNWWKNICPFLQTWCHSINNNNKNIRLKIQNWLRFHMYITITCININMNNSYVHPPYKWYILLMFCVVVWLTSSNEISKSWKCRAEFPRQWMTTAKFLLTANFNCFSKYKICRVILRSMDVSEESNPHSPTATVFLNLSISSKYSKYSSESSGGSSLYCFGVDAER